MSTDRNWEKLLDFLESEQQKGNTLTSEEQQRLTELRKLVSETADAFQLYQSFNIDQKWDQLKAEGVSRGLAPSDKPKTYKLWPRIAIAAAIATVIFSAGLFYYANNKAKVEIISQYTDSIAPGKQGATLTLGDGKKIRLTNAANGEIAKQAGISVIKTADGQLVYEIKKSAGESNKINTLTTAKGETYILTLPDKSKVWLNAASSLTYSAALNERGVRRVKLTGEAYFEISKDKIHPFVVESMGQQVEVLGTHFNINAYTEEDAIKTTLLEGKVEISKGATRKELLPGEQALTSLKLNSITISKSEDTESVIAWKNNVFYFNEASVEVIMRQISRWYNVEIIYNGAVPKGVFSGKMSRSSSLSELIKKLSYAGLNCDFKNGRLVVEPNN